MRQIKHATKTMQYNKLLLFLIIRILSYNIRKCGRPLNALKVQDFVATEDKILVFLGIKNVLKSSKSTKE